MTAFSLALFADRICLASETLFYSGAEASPTDFGQKFLTLPHLRAVLFGTGAIWLNCKARAALMLHPELQTIETAADALPAILRELTEDHLYRAVRAAILGAAP